MFRWFALIITVSFVSFFTYGQDDNVNVPSLDVLKKKLKIRLLKELANMSHTKKSQALKKTTEKPKSSKVLTSMMKLRIIDDSDVCRSFSFFKRVDSCSCRPRSMPLDVSSDINFQNRLFPMCVEAKRCAGYCPRKNTKCVPAQKTMRQYPSIELIGGEAGCKAMLIEEHVSCSCSCATDKDQCTKNQIFNEKSCKCECPEKDEIKKCLDQGKEWNSKHCLCKCRQTGIICSTGNVFDQEKCKCVPSKLSPELNNILRDLLNDK